MSFTASIWINKQLRIPKLSLHPPRRHTAKSTPQSSRPSLFSVVPGKHHPIATTTVSKFFTDKYGAAPPEPSSEDSTNSTASGKRPSLFHRLHIHSSGRRTKTVPNLTIRPTTSSSLPHFSSAESRPATSHSNAATISEITQIMPRSLRVGTPPTNSSIKRQRSRESETGSSLSGKASSTGASGNSADHDDLAKTVTVKIPSYLNKTPAGKCLSILSTLLPRHD